MPTHIYIDFDTLTPTHIYIIARNIVNVGTEELNLNDLLPHFV